MSQLTVQKIGKNVPSAAPKVSVIIPVYNVSAYAAETLDSVFAQTYKDFEVILVNDGSTDTEKLMSVLAPYFDRIVYAEQENAGASKARNSAIDLARGELLAFLDGDDVWLPDFLASQTDFLESNDFEMVYCDALIFGETIADERTFMDGSPSNGAVSTVSLINAECNVITSGTVLKRDLIDKFGLFDVAIRRGQDFDLWFRLAKNSARIGYQKKVLLKYRVRADNLTGSNVNRSERNLSVMNWILEKYDLNSIEKAAWEKQMRVYEAELELEKGKMCLATGDYVNAKAHLSSANRFYRQPKLSLINCLLRFSPPLTVRLIKAVRPAEFSYISPEKS